MFLNGDLRAARALPELAPGLAGAAVDHIVAELERRHRTYSGVRLTGRIAGFFEEVPAFVGAEQGADVAQGGPERLERARRRLAQERFDLGERHLDWVQ